jgi:CRP-like cAMP-binding protein
MNTVSDPRQNHLLATLQGTEFDRLLPYLEVVQMETGEIVHESGEELAHAYFPLNCIFSLQYVLENGASAELAGVGNEGMLGISVFMGGSSTPSRAFVQTAGAACRLRSDRLRREFAQGGQLMKALLLYTQAFITQISQTAVCNRRHTIEQQLSRWLLQTVDRSSSSDLVTTQELIAGMLGVRREGITEAAQKLQGAGLIQYRRGHINVIDRARLENYSCECYKVVRREFGRLFSMIDPGAGYASIGAFSGSSNEWRQVDSARENLIADQKIDATPPRKAPPVPRVKIYRDNGGAYL